MPSEKSDCGRARWVPSRNKSLTCVGNWNLAKSSGSGIAGIIQYCCIVPISHILASQGKVEDLRRNSWKPDLQAFVIYVKQDLLVALCSDVLLCHLKCSPDGCPVVVPKEGTEMSDCSDCPAPLAPWHHLDPASTYPVWICHRWELVGCDCQDWLWVDMSLPFWRAEITNYTLYTVSGIVWGPHVFLLDGVEMGWAKIGMFMSELWLGCPKTQSVTIQGSADSVWFLNTLRLFDPFVWLCGGSCGSLSNTRNQILVRLASWMLDHARTRLQTLVLFRL